MWWGHLGNLIATQLSLVFPFLVTSSYHLLPSLQFAKVPTSSSSFFFFLKLPGESNWFLTCPQCILEYDVLGTAKLVASGLLIFQLPKIFPAIVSFTFLPVLEDLCFKKNLYCSFNRIWGSEIRYTILISF